MGEWIRVMIVDDQKLLREGFRRLIELEGDFEVGPGDRGRFSRHQRIGRGKARRPHDDRCLTSLRGIAARCRTE